MPEEISFVSATGPYALAAGVVTWEIESLSFESAMEFTVTVLTDSSVEKNTKIENLVSVSSGTPDPKDKNNKDDAKTTIHPGPLP
jgi:hypothetical protein